MLIWNISNSTWRQLIVLWKVQNHNVRSSGHNARSALLDRGTGTIDLRQLLFWHRTFSCDPTNYERCLHPSDTLAYRSVHINSFLTLRIYNPRVKKGIGLLLGLFKVLRALLFVLIPSALEVVGCLQRAEARRHRHLVYSKKERRGQSVIGWWKIMPSDRC